MLTVLRFAHRGQVDTDAAVGFTDPDGNTWAVQQLNIRAEKPSIPLEAQGRFGA